MIVQPTTSNQTLPEYLVIPKLTRLTAPGKMVFVAIHTQDIQVSGTRYKKVLVYGHAIYWRREKKRAKEKIENFAFTNTFDFWQWVTSKINKRETLYLYAHDVSVDFLAMDGFRQLPSCGFVLQSVYHKFATTIMRFQDETKRLAVLDIQNYYPLSVEKLAESFGSNLPPQKTAYLSDQEIINYCKIKAGLLATVLNVLVKETVESGRGSLKMTASSISQSIFRHSFMKHKIVTNHNPDVVAFEHAAYAGGYTGLSKLVAVGDQDLFHVDVNSMYPSVMVDAKFPTRLVEFADGVSIRNLERFLHSYLAIARVTLHAKNAVYPVTGAETNYYPVGDFETTLTTASLKQALANNEIEAVHQIAVYEGEPIFKEFVQDVYERRQNAKAEGNTAQELFYKIINNTLYGKFGQQKTKTLRVGDCDLDEFSIMEAFSPKDGNNWQEMHAGGSILFIYRAGENEYSSFAIAGHITDYARMKLFALRRQAGVENVAYMDTDSLFVNRTGFENVKHLINPWELGALKVVDQASFFLGIAKKDYVFGEERKIKGFDKNGKRVEGNIFQSVQRTGIWGAARHSLSGGAFWKDVNKFYKPFLLNERFEENGLVTPLRLPDDFEQLGVRRYTMMKVKELAKHMLPERQLQSVGEWLNL